MKCSCTVTFVCYVICSHPHNTLYINWIPKFFICSNRDKKYTQRFQYHAGPAADSSRTARAGKAGAGICLPSRLGPTIRTAARPTTTAAAAQLGADGYLKGPGQEFKVGRGGSGSGPGPAVVTTG